MSIDTLQRFLLDDLDIRGAIVRLGPTWQQIVAGRNYAAPVAGLLGEMCATSLFIADALKQPGRITFQLRASGPVSLLVVDVNEQLNLRAMAHAAADVAPGSAPQLLGQGQLLLSLDLPNLRQPYQSVVPMQGASIAEVFEHYLGLSEQLPSRLFLAASGEGAAGIFLQKLPKADERDADGWNRIENLAATVSADELLNLSADALLTRLFSQETVRVFAARKVVHDCPEDWDKVRTMLRALGREEVEKLLREHGEVLIRDDLANRDYRFDAAAIEALFTEAPPTLH